MTRIKKFLTRAPQPTRLRIRVGDEERIVELAEDRYGRWKIAEETILSSEATSVEALDDKDRLLRAMPLDPVDDDPRRAEEKEEKKRQQAQAAQHRELAAILDRYGDRLERAFSAGAERANAEREQLLTLTATLTKQLVSALTGMHAQSVQVANLVQQLAAVGGGGEEDGAGEHAAQTEQLQQLLAMAAMKFLGGVPTPNAGPPATPKAAAPPGANGAKR
jgi:hypothetical protein